MLFALLISVVIALLLTAFLSLIYTTDLFRLQSNFLKQSIQHSHAGVIQSFKPSNSFIDSLDIEIDDTSSIALKQEFWGSYSKITSVGKVKKKVFSTMALTGSKSPTPSLALYLTNESPLILMDNALIIGATFVSGMGVQASTIKDQRYKREQLIYGSVQRSGNHLPEIQRAWKKYAMDLIDFIPTNEILVSSTADSIVQSFYEPLKVVYSPGKIFLEKKIIGNVLVKSNTEVEINSNAILKDVVVIAPIIRVHSSFKGNAHLMATKQVIIDANAQLDYPSSMVVINEDNNPNRFVQKGQEPIVFRDGSQFAGNVIFLNDVDAQINENSDILIENGALVKGSLYCEGNMECDGIIQGSVYAKGLVTDFRSSKRVNHLRTGQIRGKDLHNDFCGLPFQLTDKGLVKWLY